eukprot:GSMAST32.ASY1.ANO1.2817.1 assembled CDS
MKTLISTLLYLLNWFSLNGAFFVDVKVPNIGTLRGLSSTHYEMFLGIPYAEPPVRFSPPIPKTWDSEYQYGHAVFNATSYGSSCMQTPDFKPPDGVRFDESCLTLNIYCPTQKASRSRPPAPVMVYIHGGGFTGGSSNEARLNGTFAVELADKLDAGFVIVTINYRLGIFGFLGGETLRAGSSGNWGILDQRLAMQWVKRHISAFGGDSSQILLSGESAGAGSVSVHLVSKNSWGTFSRASLQSGAFATWISNDWISTNEDFDRVVKYTNCESKTHRNVLHCLRHNTTTEKLLEAQAQSSSGYSPTIDGVTLLDVPWKLAQRGSKYRAPGVSIIVGSVAEDSTFPDFNTNCTKTECTFYFYFILVFFLVRNFVPKHFFFHHESQIVDLYPPEEQRNPGNQGDEYSRYYWGLIHLLADSEETCPARRAARWFSSSIPNNKLNETSAFWYYFSHVPVASPPGQGASHADDIPFTFHVTKAPHGQTLSQIHGTKEKKLSKKMSTMWRTFAMTGKPQVRNSFGHYHSIWPEFLNTTQEIALQFDGFNTNEIGIVPIADLRQRQCDFWDKHIDISPVF